MSDYEAIKAEGEYAFEDNKNPKCPHCGKTIDIHEHDWISLYSYDGDYFERECPYCDGVFDVNVYCEYTFDTVPDEYYDEENDE
jgi:phage FluMu protein Com